MQNSKELACAFCLIAYLWLNLCVEKFSYCRFAFCIARALFVVRTAIGAYGQPKNTFFRPAGFNSPAFQITTKKIRKDSGCP